MQPRVLPSAEGGQSAEVMREAGGTAGTRCKSDRARGEER
jgi:hypothetical protein